MLEKTIGQEDFIKNGFVCSDIKMKEKMGDKELQEIFYFLHP